MGDPVPLVEGVMGSSGNAGPIHFASSNSGIMAWLPGGQRADSEWKMTWVGMSGETEFIFSDEAYFFSPRLSPDGSRLAVLSGFLDQLWIYDVERGAPVRVTVELTTGYGYAWSPSGEQIVFSAERLSEDTYDIWMRDANLGAEPERLFEHPDDVAPESWSPTGRYLAFTDMGSESDIYIYDFETDSVSTFLATGADESQSAFSPDGNWLAYTSDVSGQHEVHIRPFPDSGADYKLSTNGGSSPVWSADGRTIYYANQDDEIFSVTVKFDPRPTFGIPLNLFRGEAFAPYPLFGATIRDFDFDRQNSRFIMMAREGDVGEDTRAQDEIRFVVNWFEELKRLVPPIE